MDCLVTDTVKMGWGKLQVRSGCLYHINNIKRDVRTQVKLYPGLVYNIICVSVVAGCALVSIGLY